MTAAELASRLGDMYRTAPKGEMVAMIHLFGIRHADEIRDCGTSPTDLAKAAGIPETYGVEVNKGINLAKYVCER
ncbi:MAG: hypothetical protein IT419_16400 [Planctomycetes bacterium]|nr:hypothetical protein [Planctomycetota bacterium]